MITFYVVFSYLVVWGMIQEAKTSLINVLIAPIILPIEIGRLMTRLYQNNKK